MPANIMQDWNFLTPKRDFYESFVAPLLMGQQLSKQYAENQKAKIENQYLPQKLEAAVLAQQLLNKQQEMTNQMTEESLPYNIPMIEANLLKKESDAQLAQLLFQQQPELFAGQMNLMGAQAGAAGAQAQQALANAANIQFLMQHPELQAQSDMAALLVGGAFPGIGGATQTSGVGGMSNQPIPSQQEINMALGQPEVGPPEPEAAAVSDALANEAAKQRILQQFNMTPPNASPAEYFMAERGFNPALTTAIKRFDTNVAANDAALIKFNEEQTGLQENNTKVRTYANDFIKNYRAAIAKGPFAERLSNLDPNAQQAQSDSFNLIPLLARGLNTGHLTDMMLNMVAQGKLDLSMYPEVAEHAFQKISSGLDLSEKYQPFVNSIASQGLGLQAANAAWTQFQRDYPLTGNKEIDRESLKHLSEYTKPIVIEQILNGKHQSRYEKGEIPIDEKVFMKLPKEVQIEIIDYYEGIQ